MCNVFWAVRVQVSVLRDRAGVYYGGCMDGVMEITTEETWPGATSFEANLHLVLYKYDTIK
jgi:hypothetical protein